MDQQTPAIATTPAAPVAVAPSAPNFTEVWPGAFGIFKVSKAAVMLNLGPILSLIAINIVSSIIISIFTPHTTTTSTSGVSYSSNSFGPLNLVGSAISLVIGLVMIRVLLDSLHGKKTSLSVAGSDSMKQFLQYFILSLLSGLAISLGFIALIIPGIIIGLRLSMAPYFLVDQNMEAIAAMKASWAATRGHSGKVLGIIGVYILIVLAVITVVGIIATAYFGILYAAAFAALYMFLNAHMPHPAAVAQPAAPVAL